MRRNSPRGSWSWWRLRRRSLRSVLILTRYIVMHRDTTSSPDRFPSLWARLGPPGAPPGLRRTATLATVEASDGDDRGRAAGDHRRGAPAARRQDRDRRVRSGVAGGVR